MKQYLDWFFIAAAARLGWYAADILIEQGKQLLISFLKSWQEDEFKYEPNRYHNTRV